MRIFPLGDNAITVEFGTEISLASNRRAIALSEFLEADPFPGFVETVPAYASTTVFYDSCIVRNSFSEYRTAFDAVRSRVERSLAEIPDGIENERPAVEIPVVFNAEASIDLEELSSFSGLAVEEAVSVFLERTYRVFMIGFLPGFPYMGEVDERIAIPRKRSPRLKVPAGSVGIAGKQTGIYPLESPGGWQIIGRTEMKMFDPHSEPSCPLRPGDQVKFIRE